MRSLLPFYSNCVSFQYSNKCLDLAAAPTRTVLKGVAKEHADSILDLPVEERDIKRLITTANLVECGFLKPGARLTPKKKASGGGSKKKRPAKSLESRS